MHYKVMEHDTCVGVTDSINAAIMLIKTLESKLDRLTTHSPYTIIKA